MSVFVHVGVCGMGLGGGGGELGWGVVWGIRVCMIEKCRTDMGAQ